MNEKDEKLQAFQKKLGDKLYNIRHIKKVKAYELAKQAGVSQPTISVYESAKKWPRLDTLIKICDALEINLIDLLEDVDSEASFTPEQFQMLSQLKAFFRKYPADTDVNSDDYQDKA